MDYRRLGDSGLEVSVRVPRHDDVRRPTPDAAPREIVAHARDHGVNFIDTADAYERASPSASPARRSRAPRPLDPGDEGRQRDGRRRNNGGLSRRWILRRCDASLARHGPRPHRHLLPA